jgi:hypothetical protein
MEQGFDVKTGSIAIGDPAMGLVTYDLRLPPGRYRLNFGALRQPTANDLQKISLDGPYLFVMDASVVTRFLEWFHRTYEECGYIIPRVEMRLDEAATTLGAKVGFYWEETLSGLAQEGVYALDVAEVESCN